MATTGSHQTRALLLAVAALLALPFAGGQQQVSATQKPTGPQLLKPGDSMKLQCSTESDSNSLMWYRHRRPDTGRATGLELLSFSYTSTSDTELKDAPQDVRDRIESVRTRAELSLTVKDLRPADSAWYYCAARDARRRESGAACRSQTNVLVSQFPASAVTEPSGGSVSFSCTVNQANYNFFWYRQIPGGAELVPLLEFYSYDKEQASEKSQDPSLGSRIGSVRLSDRSVNLTLSGLLGNDSALYLCASRDTQRCRRAGGACR